MYRIEEIYEVFLTMEHEDEVDLILEHYRGSFPAKLVKDRSHGYIVSEREGCPAWFSGASTNKYSTNKGYNSWGLGTYLDSFIDNIGTLESGKHIMIKLPPKKRSTKVYKNYKIMRR